MTHTIHIDSKSVLIGVAAALLCVVAMGQLSVASTPTNLQQFVPAKGVGNPHPKEMVQLTSNTLTSSSVQVVAGGELELLQVPNDRWLVLLLNANSDATGVGIYSGGGAALCEDSGGILTQKAKEQGAAALTFPSAGPIGDLVGWTFKPGSRVVIKNTSPSSPITLSYNLFGYLMPL